MQRKLRVQRKCYLMKTFCQLWRINLCNETNDQNVLNIKWLEKNMSYDGSDCQRVEWLGICLCEPENNKTI